MRLPRQLGHTALALHENATTWCSWQVLQKRWAKPRPKIPQGKHQNTLRGRWEAFWASEQTSVVELVAPEDVLAKMVYAIANPVTGHLV
jgi:hypothetical protein